MRTYFQAYIVVLHKVFPRAGCMQARKTVQRKIVEKKIVCRTDEQVKLVQKLVKENCSSVRGFMASRLMAPTIRGTRKFISYN